TKRKHIEDASEAVAGVRIVALRLVHDTRAKYTSILERFKRWLLCEHREFVVDSVIQLPLSTILCQTYLDYASIKRDATGSELVPKRFNSFLTIGTSQMFVHTNIRESQVEIWACAEFLYSIGTSKSALKYLYKEANLKMHDDLDARLKDFANGYKRRIAQLKEDGEMPIGEGKLPMTIDGSNDIVCVILN
ncbi:hypothetical protein DYB26_011457, partial [Aphanomyces astaci]